MSILFLLVFLPGFAPASFCLDIFI
jgi:hypothetical protein